MIGQSIAHYRVTALIGKGGMGEVYRARDTKLDRDVAIKVLPEAFARDPERMARFEREAKVLASLNHPNIAHIYGVEDRALIMEFVDGQSPKGPMAFDEAWKIASQMADALEYAHEMRVVHRDLKPANVKVTPEGVVKLLDFGLAKAYSDQPQSGSDDPENSPTLTMGATVVGTVLGTAAYMAPEQAKGKKTDKRADIWSWGVVLYELVTGERLFKGSDRADTLAQVLMKEPDLERVPPKARRLLGECLQKEPKQRLRDIGDARRLLEASTWQAEPASLVLRLGWIAAALFAAAMLALGILYFRKPAQEPPLVAKLSILPPENATIEPELPAVSPDGRHVAFVAYSAGQRRIWVRDLDSLAARLLPGTEDGWRPFWSPDSRNIGFFANGKLKRIAMAGGPALPLADSPHTYFGAWSKDDVILFTPNDAIFRVSASRGTRTQVTNFDPKTEQFHAVDSFLPDGRHFLYTIVGKGETFMGDLDSRERHAILSEAPPPAVYAPPGYLLFTRDRALMAQPFDADKGRITGDAAPLGEIVDRPSTGPAWFSVSQSGVLVYFPNGAARQLRWFDRGGRPAGTLGPQGLIPKGAISPDGKTVAFEKRDESPVSIWLHDVAHGGDSLFERDAQRPVWSGDGSYVVFRRRGQLYRKAVNGAGQAEALDLEAQDIYAADWSSDGRYLIEERPRDPKTGDDIWVLRLSGDRKPYPLLHSDANESDAQLSPNMRWLAYVSDESKHDEVYVVTFPNPGRPWKISSDGGDRPVWSRDGKELYFISADRKMMAVEVRAGATFDYGEPKPLFDAPIGLGRFDIGKDGRFLIPAPAGQGGGAMHVVMNWPGELKK